MVSATKHKVKMVRLILSDLDHTLLRQDGSVSDETLRVLDACRKQGVVFAIATARYWIGAEKYIYFKVGAASGGLEVTMERETPDTEEESSSESSSTISRFVVRIDGPEGAEVYLNGGYIGIAPVSFGKEAGTHIITLRKTGYETRSYTIQVDSEEKDIAYSFADLAPTTTVQQ